MLKWAQQDNYKLQKQSNQENYKLQIQSLQDNYKLQIQSNQENYKLQIVNSISRYLNKQIAKKYFVSHWQLWKLVGRSIPAFANQLINVPLALWQRKLVYRRSCFWGMRNVFETRPVFQHGGGGGSMQLAFETQFIKFVLRLGINVSCFLSSCGVGG